MCPYKVCKKTIAVIVFLAPILISCLNPVGLGKPIFQTVAQGTAKQGSSSVKTIDPAITILPVENKLKSPILVKEARENGLVGKRFTLKRGEEIQFYEEEGLLKARLFK